jgi:hypothetical protein
MLQQFVTSVCVWFSVFAEGFIHLQTCWPGPRFRVPYVEKRARGDDGRHSEVRLDNFTFRRLAQSFVQADSHRRLRLQHHTDSVVPIVRLHHLLPALLSEACDLRLHSNLPLRERTATVAQGGLGS